MDNLMKESTGFCLNFLRNTKVLLKLLRRVLVHKFWVAYYCFQAGLYWQGLTHDLSKFGIVEIKGATKYWDDHISSLNNEKKIEGYSKTFLHHRGRNPHHYEYWIHSLDDGGIPAEMPRKYAIELACDYLAACRTYGGNPRDEIVWWREYSPKMKIHEATKSYVNNIFQGFNRGMTLKAAINFANMLCK